MRMDSNRKENIRAHIKFLKTKLGKPEEGLVKRWKESEVRGKHHEEEEGREEMDG